MVRWSPKGLAEMEDKINVLMPADAARLPQPTYQGAILTSEAYYLGNSFPKLWRLEVYFAWRTF